MVGRRGWSGWGKGINLHMGASWIILRLMASENNRTKRMNTTYPLKVQASRSQGQQPRLYVSFPLALAAAIRLEPGETVQWELLDRGELHLVRPTTPPTTTNDGRLNLNRQRVITARFCLRPGFSTLLRRSKTKNSSMVQGRPIIGTAANYRAALDAATAGRDRVRALGR